MSSPLNDKMAALASKAEAALPGLLLRVPSLPDELCYEVQPAHIKQVCLTLRDDPGLKFETLVDLAGIDYLDYASTEWKTYSATRSGFSRGVNRSGVRIPHEGARFAVAYNLLSVTNNQRLRIRARCSLPGRRASTLAASAAIFSVWGSAMCGQSCWCARSSSAAG